MTELNEYTPGTFCWAELATSDADAARTFYSELFGWDLRDVPISETSVYTMAEIDGREVAALYQMNDEQEAMGVPPHWMSYVSVGSADEAAERAAALGGQVIVEPMDVFAEGRMALFQDPTGAMISVWQPGNHIGARLANEPGTLVWNELATTDTEVAGEFYTDLFGWEAQTNDVGDTRYTTFMNGDRVAGGMLTMTEEWGDVPSHWMIYFAVADCESTVEQAEALGGTVLVPPSEAAGIGTFAMLQDPQGATFAVIAMDQPQA